MPAPEKLAALRQLLTERFPRVAPSLAPTVATRALPTGVPSLDEACGGLPLGAIAELVCAAPSCGSHLVLGALLEATRTRRLRLALVDATDTFDPESFPDDLLPHVLWTRCRSTAEALQTADLVARDANLGLVVLDLRRAADSELRRIPATQWYRLQRAVEPSDLALLVQTPRALVASAQIRFALTQSHGMAQLESERRDIVAHATATVQRQRLAAAG